MKPKDLESGMIVKIKKGIFFIVFGDYLVNETIWSDLKYFNGEFTYYDNFSHKSSDELSIVEIYARRDAYYLRPSKWFENMEEEPIWEKEEDVNWTEVPMWTKVQVKDDYNKKWKNAYFIKYENGLFFATMRDKFTYNNELNNTSSWDCCRLYKEE